jgi:hypothetical protein
MAVQDEGRATATGTDQGDVRRRNVSGQPNGNYIPKELDDKVDEKTKQKVSCYSSSCSVVEDTDQGRPTPSYKSSTSTNGSLPRLSSRP